MMKRSRTKPRPGRMTAEELDALRAECWLRDGGKCQECGNDTLFNAPIEWDNSFHMAHIKNKRMYGDHIDNVQTECGRHHREYHAFGPSRVKPVRSKHG